MIDSDGIKKNKGKIGRYVMAKAKHNVYVYGEQEINTSKVTLYFINGTILRWKIVIIEGSLKIKLVSMTYQVLILVKLKTF